MIIRPEFQTHDLSAAGIEACTTLRAAFTNLLTTIEETVPAGRERSLVVTKLQEACNWAVRAAATAPLYHAPRQ